MSLNIQHFHDNKEKYIETLDISTEGPCTMVDGKMVCQEFVEDYYLEQEKTFSHLAVQERLPFQ